MNNSKKMIIGLLALIFVFGTATTQAASNKNKPAENPAVVKAPIVVEADELYFSDSTGDLYAKGNVQVKQNNDIVQADLLNGNAQKNEVWTDGKALLSRPGMNLTGTGIHYNLSDHSGTMQAGAGRIDEKYITSKKLVTTATQTTITDGTVTECPAQVPDYHISADRVEIWPGDKMIAYNAKFWIKNTVIYSLAKYQTSLAKGEEGAPGFPKPSYSSENGVGISVNAEMPLSPHLAAFADLGYYSKVRFKPMFGLISRNTNFIAKLSYGNEENSDNEWIKKEPELSLSFKPYRLGSSSLSLSIGASAGQWKEGRVSGTHQGYNLYIGNDPIVLGPKTTLNLGAGFSRNFYGYDNSQNSMWKFDSRLSYKASSRLDTWVGYNYRSDIGTTPYEFDKVDIAKEGRIGFMYKVDRLNSLGVKISYDLASGSSEDIDYTWKRNLHCFEADITYRAKRDEIRVKVSTIKW